MAQHGFSTRLFAQSENPWQYMQEAGWEATDFHIAETELSRLQGALSYLDEYHLAFAMVIAERICPTGFALQAADMLNHPSMSVRVNAYRVLRAVPLANITDKLRYAVRNGLATCPECNHFRDALDRT